MATEIKLPILGENIDSGEVSKILVSVGDTVTEDQPVIELETEKATVEVPTSAAGTVKEIRVKEGETIKVGQVILTVEAGAESRAECSTGSGSDRPKAAPQAKPEEKLKQRAEAQEGKAKVAAAPKQMPKAEPQAKPQPQSREVAEEQKKETPPKREEKAEPAK